MELPELAKYRHGAFTVLTLAEYIRVHKITLIIHAAHPFATELHTTIDQAAQFKDIPVLRIEREYPIRTCHENVHYVESYDEISNMLSDKYSEKTSLFLTGVQSINKLESHWKTEKSYFRILDRETSIETALAQDFPQDQLHTGRP